MRRKLRLLLMLGVMTLSVTALSIPAYCFGCGDDHDCQQEQLIELNACCQLWGCDSGATLTYCSNRAMERYCACRVLKGCPIPNCGINY